MVEQWAENFPIPGNEPVSDKIVALDLGKINPNPFQPRREFSTEKIDELADSIKTCGLIQPIVVRRIADGYQLVVGERRTLACRRLGWKKISAAVVNLNDDAMATAALIENLQREDLNFIEEAMGYVSLMKRFSITQEVLAKRLGKSQSTIANKIRLLKLPEAVKAGLAEKKLTERHARALLRLNTEDQQLKMIGEMAEQNLTVIQTEKKIKALSEHKNKTNERKKAKPVVKDMRIVLNTIREAVGIINGAGLYPEIEETVEPEGIEIRIRLTRSMLASGARQQKK